MVTASFCPFVMHCFASVAGLVLVLVSSFPHVKCVVQMKSFVCFFLFSLFFFSLPPLDCVTGRNGG